ncbi:PadR family transcriptional regulator [Nocardia arthritidis]|uniref:PadR family transcriptional regulator n=1 Tax=Nocardia arthritidis TaxID=228602 RepID=UPI00142E6792|nr:PadR family transcriptional regulator [Nocardia arthritidis]
MRTAILVLLAEQPLHGYQVIQQIEARSGGVWRPSPGSVYPTLQQLEDEGLVSASEVDGRKVYRLSDSGQALVEDRAEEFSTIWNSVTRDVDDGLMEVNGLTQQVMIAASQVTQIGSDAQLTAAAQILSETRRRLYQLLADGDAGKQE